MSLLLFNADFSLLSDDLDAVLVLVLNCCCGIGMFGCWPFMNGNGKFIGLCAAAGFIWRCCWANAAARCGGNGHVDAAGFVADGWLPRLCMKARVSNSRRSDSGSEMQEKKYEFFVTLIRYYCFFSQSSIIF